MKLGHVGFSRRCAQKKSQMRADFALRPAERHFEAPRGYLIEVVYLGQCFHVFFARAQAAVQRRGAAAIDVHFTGYPIKASLVTRTKRAAEYDPITFAVTRAFVFGRGVIPVKWFLVHSYRYIGG